MLVIKCVNCGNEFSCSPGPFSAVNCENCGAVLSVEGKESRLMHILDKMSIYASRLSVGKIIVYDEGHYRVTGVCRYEYYRCFFYVWHLISHNCLPFYLIEDEGYYNFIDRIDDAAALPGISEINTERLLIQGSDVNVRRTFNCRITGTNGCLTYKMPVNSDILHIRGISARMELGLFSFDDTLMVLKGKLINYDDIKIVEGTK